MSGAVEELTRYVGPQLLTIPRFARADVVLDGVEIAAGDSVTVSIAAVNRDARAFADPDRLDLTRSGGHIPHLGYAHGPVRRWPGCRPRWPWPHCSNASRRSRRPGTYAGCPTPEPGGRSPCRSASATGSPSRSTPTPTSGFTAETGAETAVKPR